MLFYARAIDLPATHTSAKGMCNSLECGECHHVDGYSTVDVRGQIAKKERLGTRRSRPVSVPPGTINALRLSGLSWADRSGLDLRNMNSVRSPNKSGGQPSEEYAHAFCSIGIDDGRGQGTVWIRV